MWSSHVEIQAGNESASMEWFPINIFKAPKRTAIVTPSRIADRNWKLRSLGSFHLNFINVWPMALKQARWLEVKCDFIVYPVYETRAELLEES